MAIHDSSNSANWGIDRFEPWWALQHRDLPYVNEPFNDPTTQQQWLDLGFTHQRFTGDLYDMRESEPDWVAVFRDRVSLEHFGWSVYRMCPGTILPKHSDTYARFCRIHGIADIALIKRYVIFLEDWTSGHYFEIDGTAVTTWRAGDAVWWNGDTSHIAANIGSTNRYTLQLTGTQT